MTFTSAAALPGDTPGLRRPTIASVLPHRLVSWLIGNGKYRSIWLPGANTEAKSNDAGRTPTTVVGSSFKVSGRPTIAGSDPKRLSQDRKSTRLNSSHLGISYAVFCL